MGILINQGRQIGGLSEQDQANIGKVTQTETTTDADYELLFSETAADATTHTEEARKSQYFKFNPSLSALTVGTRNSSHNVYSGSVVLGSNCAAHSYAMSQGLSNIAVGESSHAEGVLTYANGEGSHAEGRGTRAEVDYQHVEGKYNLFDFDNDYAHIIGNGYYDENNDREIRSNAFGVRWNGQLDVYNDIVRQDTNGTWDGAHASLIDTLNDKAAKSIIANEYDNTATYEYGDYCIYENTLYLCDALQIVAEDFDPTKWIATSIAAENIGFTNWIKTKVSKTGDAMSGQLAGITSGGAWKSARDNASFKKTGAQNTSTYYPILSVRGYSYDWSMGTLGNDSNKCLYFVRTFDSDYSATGNVTQNFVLYGGSAGAASSYTIAHSGNVGTGDSNGKVKIAGVNVAVKGLGSRAYDSTAYLPLAGGTCTGDVYFKKKIDVTNWSNFRGGLWTTGLSLEGGFEIAYSTPYIDFHYNKDTHDYTHRLICSSVGNWDFLSKNTASTQAWVSTILNAEQFKVRSSIHIKENIKDIEEDEALKLLELRPVSFDYKDRADGKDQRGLIAEEVMDILPNTVLIPEGYTEFDPKNPNNVPGIDYSKFVPYLIKLCQIQQEQINTLTEKLDNLNKN